MCLVEFRLSRVHHRCALRPCVHFVSLENVCFMQVSTKEGLFFSSFVDEQEKNAGVC